MEERERRRCVRYPTSLEVVAQELSPSGTPNPSVAAIHGEARNISDGGLCVVFDQVHNPTALLRCGILVPGCSVGIPTLAHVRWIGSEKGKIVAGVEFLLQ